MTELYGTDPKDVVAAVGPSICQDCYEVSKDVVEQFRENYDEKYWEKLFYEKENGKYQLISGRQIALCCRRQESRRSRLQ